VEVAPVRPERWDDLVELFERKGPRGGTPMTDGCWCMWWRKRTGDRAKNKRAMRELVRGGREPGLLAYEDDVPVGWVSVAPREEFGQLLSSRVYRPQDDDPDIWSIVCFYLDVRAKKRGVAPVLLDGAIEHAFAHGARALEAYPFASGKDYMGVRKQYEGAGFERVRRTEKRLVMRRTR
jgi:GNAT superfamily N-acetyltransferase